MNFSFYRHTNDVKEPTRIIRQGSALSFTPFFKLEEAMCLQKHGFFFCLALKGKGRGVAYILGTYLWLGNMGK